MDWITKMNTAVEYIEKNLDGKIDYIQIAKLANCSAYHFQRVFSYMAGASLAEYIRRRRLTMAAFDLQSSDEKVIDIALKYGYESPTAFSRAFQAFHQMTPSEAKTGGKTFTSYPPISFQIIVKGVVAMNYRIEKKDAFRVVGVKLETTMETEEASKEVPEFWGKMHQNGTIAKVVGLMNQEPFGLIGMSVGTWENGKKFDYYIAASTDKQVPDDMVAYTVPASQWAVFECVGPMPNAIQELQKRVFTEWLPTSGYEYANIPDLEVYGDGDNAAPDYKCQVWLPVVKK